MEADKRRKSTMEWKRNMIILGKKMRKEKLDNRRMALNGDGYRKWIKDPGEEKDKEQE